MTWRIAFNIRDRPGPIVAPLPKAAIRAHRLVWQRAATARERLLENYFCRL